MNPKHKLLILVISLFPMISLAQENSPYSRYGVGDLVPSGNVLNRGMGGASAGYADPATINFINPASYSNLVYTTLDIGGEVDSRTLKSLDPIGKFTANNALVSYVQLGIPLLNGNKKAFRNKISWGMNAGLRQISRINYKISTAERLTNIDSLSTIYEGSGGINEAFIGTGVKIRNFSIGVNAGYLFGNKEYSTRLIFINDTVAYNSSNSDTKTNFGGVSFNAGFQYEFKLKSKDKNAHDVLRIGAYGNLQQKYNATQDVLRETFVYNSVTGNPDKLDSVYEQDDQKGTIVLPYTYGVGFSLEKTHWIFGADFIATNWDNYSLYGQKDFVKNNWTVKAGFQYFPATSQSKKYSNFIKYRAGVFFGPDYIDINQKLPQFGVSVGAGFPLKLKRSFYETQYSVMNLGLEYGNRGNKNNNISENILRITLGFSLSDVWFRRYKYD